MGQSAGTTPGKKSGSVFDQSAAGLGNAGKATLAAGRGFAGIANSPTGGLGSTAGQTYNPAKTKYAGYQAEDMRGAGYNATDYDAAGYNAANMKGAGYGAARQATPDEIASGISTYMNPYTKDVIARSQQDINRQTEMGLRDLGATASGQGAFGGSRHGIAEGTAIGEGSKALGDISAQMRAEGYNTAAGLAGQDVANRMAAAGANQQAINQAREFTAGNTQAARAANQAAENAQRAFNAGNLQQARAYQAEAENAQRQYNASNTQAARAANQAAENAQRQYNAGSLQEARQFNAGAVNTARQYNAGARTTNANQAIQNRLAALTGLQGAGQQGAALAGQGMGIGQGLSGQQAAGGQTLRGISEALIGQSAGMFDRYTGQPLESTAAILNMLSGNPLSGTGTTTQTNTPGLKSTLGSALGLAGRAIPGAP